MNNSKFLYNMMVKRAWIWILVISLTSCNKEVENLLKQDYPGEVLGKYGKTKVLYIMIDGAKGDAVRLIAPPTIMQMTRNSLFTWYSLSDPLTSQLTGATGWANQMTGVMPAKHNVISEDFTGSRLQQYPSFITRAEETNSSLRTVAYSSSANFARNFTERADVSATFNGDDLKVKDAVVNSLKSEAADILVAQFNSVDAAGLASGYSENIPAYRNAILTIDNYIGEITAALNARPNFAAENWMVIISSNRGGNTSASVNSAFVDGNRNTFTLFYSPKFSSSFIQQPLLTDVAYAGFAPRFTYASATNNAAVTSTTAYNFTPANSKFTVQVMVKNAKGSTTNLRPNVVSKRDNGVSGNGWALYLTGTGWGFSSSLSADLPVSNVIISDNKWHVMTAVVNRESDLSCTVKLYTDGVFNLSGNRAISASTTFVNAIPLRIGRTAGSSFSGGDLLISNLQIYDRVLTDAEIASVSCRVAIDQSHPFYSNLIGYWPLDEVNQSVMTERTGKMGNQTNFTLTAPFLWKDFNDASPAVCPTAPAAFFRTVPNGVDVPFQIFQWMSVPINNTWGWDGNGQSPIYSIIKP